MKTSYIFVFILAAAIFTLIMGACSPEKSKSPIPTPDVVVKARPSFSQDILPIFRESCIQCHGPQDARNGLRLDSYERVTKGTQLGTVIVPGDPAMSPLVALLKHESDPKIWMPYHKEQLSPNRIKNIENWIRYQAPNN